ncbi:TetR/AcrR family transcriptional regulator [Acidocella sp.]|uniref:TetR/AcrR family transcriptional regulator n=1 Tax=Acidocella sp. TaxID=50710 RepID=UPI003D070640
MKQPQLKLVESSVMAVSPAKPARGRKRAAWGKDVPGQSLLRDLKIEALHETAARIFNERGFHGTSIADIASALGVSISTLYHYIDSKQDLLYQLHDLTMRQAERVMRDAPFRTELTGLERLRHCIYDYLIEIMRSPTSCLVLFEAEALKPEHAAEILRRRDALEQGLRRVVRDGVADGSLSPCDPKLAIFTVLGAINWITRWYKPNGELPPEQIAHSITQQLLRGLASAPDTLILPLP